MSGDPSGFRFSVANASKDIGYHHAMTDELGVARGVAMGVRDLYAAIEDQEVSVPEVIGVLERDRD